MSSDIQIGSHAPDFKLSDSERNDRELSEFKGKNLILAFFPGAFTATCQRELCTFRDRIDRLSDMNVSVVGISVDSPFANKAFSKYHNLPFPILSDYMRQVVRKYGIELKDFAGLEGYTAAKRSVFLTDKDGIVRYKWVSDDPDIEPDYDEVERAANELFSQ